MRVKRCFVVHADPDLGVDYFQSLKEPFVRARVREALQAATRVHIARFMDDGLARLLRDTLEQAQWSLVLSGEGERRELESATLAGIDEAAHAAVTQAVWARAKVGFQCFYEANRIGGDFETGKLTAGPLAEFVSALNSAPVLERLRDMTGDDRIVYADATATRFRPGHLLTAHTDDVSGEDRLYAYVLNLSAHWRPDWGGLLMFYDENGHVAEAFTPKWGALNLFAVPQSHAVSLVAPFAGEPRYAISGWLRARRPPGSRFGAG